MEGHVAWDRHCLVGKVAYHSVNAWWAANMHEGSSPDIKYREEYLGRKIWRRDNGTTLQELGLYCNSIDGSRYVPSRSKASFTFSTSLLLSMGTLNCTSWRPTNISTIAPNLYYQNRTQSTGIRDTHDRGRAYRQQWTSWAMWHHGLRMVMGSRVIRLHRSSIGQLHRKTGTHVTDKHG
jgi:hypothetical protein